MGHMLWTTFLSHWYKLQFAGCSQMMKESLACFFSYFLSFLFIFHQLCTIPHHFIHCLSWYVIFHPWHHSKMHGLQNLKNWGTNQQCFRHPSFSYMLGTCLLNRRVCYMNLVIAVFPEALAVNAASHKRRQSVYLKLTNVVPNVSLTCH